jgi:hypothetical protein
LVKSFAANKNDSFNNFLAGLQQTFSHYGVGGLKCKLSTDNNVVSNPQCLKDNTQNNVHNYAPNVHLHKSFWHNISKGFRRTIRYNTSINNSKSAREAMRAISSLFGATKAFAHFIQVP